MKKFLVFLLCASLFFVAFKSTTYATPNIHLSTGESRYISTVPAVISGDVYLDGNKCHDDNENTFSVIVVNQATTVRAPWGCDIIYDQTESQVIATKQSSGKTRDYTATVWPRGSSSQPGSTDWPLGIWKQLYPGQFLVVQSGITYYNFTSQSQYTNSISITKHTSICTTQTVWIWTTISAKIHTTDPGYEKITLTPPSSNPNPNNEEWLYSNIPAHGFSTGWIEAEINGSWVDLKESCLNGLVVENNSNQQIRIRYKQADPNDPRDRKLVSIYSSGNSLESIKTHYANTLNVPVSHLSIRKIFPN